MRQGPIYYSFFNFFGRLFQSLYRYEAQALREKETMDSSIKLYDQLHSCGRDEAMSIEEANAEGCKFYDNEATRQAFADFRECFRNFCEEQNCIEGEPFAQEAPSIKTYLDLHKATKKPSRRLKIGVNAPPVISIARQTDAFQLSSTAPPAPRSLLQKVKEVQQPTATIVEKVSSEAKLASELPKTVNKMSMKDEGETFESYVQGTDSIVFKDAVFFIPKNYNTDFLKNKAEYVKRHGFRGREEILNKLLRFRNLMRSSKWTEANDIEIVSMTGTKHKVGNITFNFTSLDDALSDRSSVPFVKMLSFAPLK